MFFQAQPVPSCLRSQKGGLMMLHQEGSGLPYHSMIYIATIMMMKWTPPHGGGVNLGAGPEVSMLAKVLEAVALL